MAIKRTISEKDRQKVPIQPKSAKKLQKTGKLEEKTADNRGKQRNKKFTPQQIDFAMRYYLPNSPTYGNVLQSALKAGYSPKYAKSGLMTRDLEWVEKILLEIVGKPTDKSTLVNKAKKVLSESLDSTDEKLEQDTAKFIANTDPEFSRKQDITSDGEKIAAPVALVEFLDGSESQSSAAK